jgi:tetratricopeptide (TPR) repeat protein
MIPKDPSMARQALETIVERFEQAWHSSTPPRIEDFLGAAPIERRALLVELVHTDLEYRLKAGQHTVVEDYLTRFPEIETNVQQVVELIEAEFANCRLLGRSPQVDAYLQRFPRYSTELADRLSKLEASTRSQDTLMPLANAAAHQGTDPEQTLATPGHLLGPWPTVPGYKILGVLGRGGMGIVYKARHLQLNRLVAVKMILSGSHADKKEHARFRAEAAAVARLQHPNIVQIHEIGESDGSPYFALEFCSGGSLDRKLGGTPMAPQEAAKLLETLARAMHHAHVQRIVHRDLKPANVLLAADGAPKVTDFGLAKKLDSQGLTLTGAALIGTPSYMPPEQAQGKTGELGPAADVYALGAVLYELLTGRPPHKGVTALDTVMQVINEEPVPPSRLQPKTPHDLETLCLQCLHKEAPRRYTSALALAEDLRRFQVGEPIIARPVGMVERAAKWAKRRPATAALILFTVFAVVGLSTATLFLTAANQREREAKNDAVQAQHVADEKEKEAVREREEARDKAQMTLQLTEYLIGLFNVSDPTGLEGLGLRKGQDKGVKLSARELLDIAAEKIKIELKDRPVIKAQLLDVLGNVYRSVGLYDKAEPLLKEGLALRQHHLGVDHKDTATSLHHLAWWYQDQGRLRDAEELYNQALAIRDKQFGIGSLESAQTMFNLAWTLGQQFEAPSSASLAKVEMLFRKVLEIRREKLGKDHRQVGVAMAALAAHVFGKDDNEAIALTFQAIAILEKAENKDAVSSAFMNYMLAVQARQRDRLDEAAKRYQELLSLAPALLGAEHPAVGLLLGDYAGLLRKKGDLPGAEKAIRQALEIGRHSWLRRHPAMIEALLELGDLERDRGKTQEAEKLYREAVDIARQFQRSNLEKTAQKRLNDMAPGSVSGKK